MIHASLYVLCESKTHVELLRGADRLDDDRRTVTENLRGAHHGSGVVTDAHDTVGALISGVGQHQLERLFAR
jgi:hypothetical protein